MKFFRAMCCTTMAELALLVIVPTAYGSALVPPQSPIAPDSWDSCATCVPLGSGIFGTGSTGPNLGFVYSVGVFTNDPLNPYGLGDLDFVYSVLNGATSTASISGIAATAFTGFSTDVGYFTATAFPGGTIAPTTVDRISANIVGFNFNSFAPGDESLVLVIKTDATAYGAGLLNITDDAGGNGSVMALAPVPEPGPVWPLGCALLGVVLYWRKRSSVPSVN